MIKQMQVKEKKTDNQEKPILTSDNTKTKELVATDEKRDFVPLYQVDYSKHHGILPLFGILFFSFLLIVFIAFCAFTISNINNPKIIGGVHIKGIDVSNLSKEEAKQKVNEYINSLIPEEISLTHNDFETSLSTSQLEIHFNTDEAVEIAYSMGRNENIFENNLTILKAIFDNINIDPGFSIDENQLKSSLSDISSKLPDKIIECSWYIEDNNLIITKGSEGSVVSVEESANYIKENINNLNVKDISLELITEIQYPKEINIDDIYKEIHKDPVDAYYTQDPIAVYPSENGLDFACSLEEAKAFLEQDASEYIIPLQITYPSITTNMIGTEAFPDLLSDFSTKYATSNRNRTTNLILAANKINGTVLMPGETFSYNQVVGERTIAAGYKEAAIYVQGKVENGLGGGICQIATTLYNAALLSNLEIVERSNHQFVPSYVGASRDATVVYGAIDFKFKNNRDYAIKLVCSVSGGIANFKIYGLKSENDYDVQITSRTTGTTSNYIYSEGYKTLSKNGTVISTEIISKDTYKRH